MTLEYKINGEAGSIISSNQFDHDYSKESHSKILHS